MDQVKIGKNVYINSNLLSMSRGGVTIEDDAMIAANARYYGQSSIQVGERQEPSGCVYYARALQTA